MANVFRTTEVMEYTTNGDKENSTRRTNNEINNQPKSPQRKEGEQELSTIDDPTSKRSSENASLSPELNAPFDEHRSRQQSLLRVSSEESDEAPFDECDEVGRMMPGVLAEGTAYTVKETLNQGYIEKKGSGFDWIGSRAWKKRWAVLVVSL